MGDLTANFSRKEFACKCGCGFDNISPKLVEALQELRDYFGQTIWVTSGCRCFSHNEAVGGRDRSTHLQGLASDIVMEEVDPADVYDFLNAAHKDAYGLKKYSDFVHFDVRTNTVWRDAD